MCVCSHVCLHVYTCGKSLSEPLGPLYHLSSLGLETQPPTSLLLPARVKVQLTWPPEASFLWLLPVENGLQPLELVEVQEATDSTKHNWKQRQRTFYRPAAQAHLLPLPKAARCHLPPPARVRQHQEMGAQGSVWKKAAPRLGAASHLGPSWESLKS